MLPPVKASHSLPVQCVPLKVCHSSFLISLPLAGVEIYQQHLTKFWETGCAAPNQAYNDHCSIIFSWTSMVN